MENYNKEGTCDLLDRPAKKRNLWHLCSTDKDKHCTFIRIEKNNGVSLRKVFSSSTRKGVNDGRGFIDCPQCGGDAYWNGMEFVCDECGWCGSR